MHTFAMLTTLRAYAAGVILCGGVLMMLGHVSAAPPNSWPPKLKNFDIWGDIDSDGVDALSSSSLTDAGRIDADDDGASDVDIVQTTYGRNETGWQRDGRVLNFFPLPVDDECLADDATRSGICLNTYECRIQGGTSKGQCALGFGVCCVFTATCDQEVFNNITYIISPNFPSLMTRDIKSCKLKIKMISSDVSQLRLDFVHFSLGQPNRSTGICDGDNFLLSGGSGGDFSICGQNHGQHIYYDVPAPKDNNNTASARDDADEGIVDMVINFSDRFAPSRLFEIRVLQIPFSQRAPAGCMQYFTGAEGIIQTFNFAENGRHLANQNYRACIRQDSDMCSIQYEPCFERAFRIGPRRQLPGLGNAGGGQVAGGNPLAGSGGLMNGGLVPGNPAALAGDLMQIPGAGAGAGVLGDDPAAAAGAPADAAAVADDQTAAASADDPNAVEGSGDGGAIPAVPGAVPAAAPAAVPAAPAAAAPAASFFSLPSFGSFFTRGFFGFGAPAATARRRKGHLWQRQGRQMPGPGFFGSGCTDRITLPCVVEDFIAAGMGNVPSCAPVHCGDSLCEAGVLPCRIESTVTPFGIGVHFGDVGAEEEKGSPEDNIGACLRYNQLRCG